MMVKGEDGQIQCSSCTGIEIKDHISIQNGKVYEVLTCKTCGYTIDEELPTIRGDYGESL